MHITRDMLSPYQLDNFPEMHVCEKLIPNLHEKIKYIHHYRNLKLYLKHGMKLTKIHRVIKFRQSAWLNSYINLNINKRKEATQQCCHAYFRGRAFLARLVRRNDILGALF